MARQDFKTIYKTEFNSGATLQNDIIPSHVDQIICLMDLIDGNYAAIRPFRNKVRSLFLMLTKVFRKPEEIKALLDKIDKELKLFETKYQNRRPEALISYCYELAEKFFYQMIEGNALMPVTAYDANRDAKVYAYLTGKPMRKYSDGDAETD